MRLTLNRSSRTKVAAGWCSFSIHTHSQKNCPLHHHDNYKPQKNNQKHQLQSPTSPSTRLLTKSASFTEKITREFLPENIPAFFFFFRAHMTKCLLVLLLHKNSFAANFSSVTTALQYTVIDMTMIYDDPHNELFYT